MDIDYAGIGFKCGIEIHQQLDTGKLFCRCRSEIKSGKPELVVKRRLRASAGETGVIDDAALHESKKSKYFLYDFYPESSCLVELDEEPPHEPDKSAVETALQVALMLNAKPVDRICFMRKTVVDGSNTSGFQRTALIARDGFIETSKGRVGIETVCLEEESAKIVSRGKELDEYNLSRLGIPLIEIATCPDIKDPDHCRESAEKIGMILRSTGCVKRGIGTIRQDVNLSVKKGARVEIKGFQDLRNMPKIIENEVKRHIKLIKDRKEVKKEVRKANSDLSTSFMRPMPGAARMYPETDVLLIRADLKDIKAPELIDNKSKRLEKELKINSDVAMVIAKSGMADRVISLAAKFKNVKPQLIAEAVAVMPKEIKKRHGVEVNALEHLDEILGFLDSGRIPKEAVFEILVEKAKGSKVDYSRYMLMSDDEIIKIIKKVISDNKGAPFNALIGIAMGRLRGKADGKKVAEILRKEAS